MVTLMRTYITGFQTSLIHFSCTIFPQRAATTKKEGGYILLLTILIVSIILAISFGIYALSIKEVILASFLRDSQRAFSAADRAVECTLYWDVSYPQNGMPYTIFASSTAYNIPGNLSSAECDGVQLNAAATTFWDVPSLTATAGVTTFSIPFSDGSYAEVRVEKDDTETVIRVNGYNSQDMANPRQTQRTIEVTTNLTGG